jgi:glycosyltransferase involved in cell wall biosynthesis
MGSQDLRIGMLSPISWRTPPRHYGPWELFVSLLTEGLVARGVDVTLFATLDSVTAARLDGVAPTGYSEDDSYHVKVYESLHIARMFERAAEFDLLHNSFDFLPLTYTRLVDTPVVTTIHGFASDATLPPYVAYADRVHYVAISDADRHPALPYAATIHHGIDLAAFEPSSGPGDHLAFFGRIHPDKGTAAAIEVATRAGVPLVIAGIVQDEAYFEESVRPHLDGDRVSYLGPVGPTERQRVLGGARALLHLIDFDEPFGFSVVEAMACGTPVIANARGSMPELIEEGVNGVLVTTSDEAVEAVGTVADLDRAAVRASVVDRFGVDRMVDDYLALYRRILAGELPLQPRSGSDPDASSTSSSTSSSTVANRAPVSEAP